MGMNRRVFVQAATTVLLLPHMGAVAGAGRNGVGAAHIHMLFFDERFAVARDAADTLRHLAAPIPVQGDVTDFRASVQDRLREGLPLTLHGITTESFRFCLHVLLQEQPELASESVAFTRDLHQWTMQTRPALHTRTA